MKNIISVSDLIREGKITSKTFDRVNIAKSYIEKKYSIKKEKEMEMQKGKKKKYKIKINRLGFNNKEIK